MSRRLTEILREDSAICEGTACLLFLLLLLSFLLLNFNFIVVVSRSSLLSAIRSIARSDRQDSWATPTDGRTRRTPLAQLSVF